MLNKSKNIVDLYVDANENKRRILFYDKTRSYSAAEVTVLSCIDAITRHSVYSRDNFDWDTSKVIRMLLYSSLERITDKLNKDKNYIDLLSEHKKRNTLESQMAKVSYIKILFSEKDDNDTINEFNDNYLKLRTTIRKGHIYWGAKGDRLESILEHIYGTMILLLGIESEYKIRINYDKVLEMLLLHETEEIKIGDLTDWDISSKEKLKIGKKAVNDVLGILKDSKYYISLIDEFNSCKTKASKLAHLIDKIEYDMQVKIYELHGKYDFENRPQNVVTTSTSVTSIINKGATSVFDVHYEYDKDKFEKNIYMKNILELIKKM